MKIRPAVHPRHAVAAIALTLGLTVAGCSDSEPDSERVEAVAAIEDLSEGETTRVALDAGFLDAVELLGLQPGVVGTGELDDDGGLVFPITGGNVALFQPGSVPNYVVGQLQHEGSGFSLEAGGTKVDIGNFNVDPGVSKVYGDVNLDGIRVAANIVIFDLNGNTLQEPILTEDTVELVGSEVLLSVEAADLLRTTFQTDDIPDGLLVGIAEITVGVPS